MANILIYLLYYLILFVLLLIHFFFYVLLSSLDSQSMKMFNKFFLILYFLLDLFS